ncbi:prostaglandin E2 receptor EP3 subtype-like [Ornithodoros turicata]|uniref:prostaglandin E2 receptor EP3 subtype-like n=1 Tax=Ornithodoros turicata TaxID=34597 RepID=UPI003138DED0
MTPWPNGSHVVEVSGGGRHLSTPGQAIITCVYLFGIFSNICSLALISRREIHRNRSHTLMLRCLVWNDLLALLGSCTVMYIQLYLPRRYGFQKCICAMRVLLRNFGLCSGCVAVVMAVERWLALTRPFVYQKHVTYTRIRNAIFTLWMVVIVVVSLPFVGMGTYYDSPADAAAAGDSVRCTRYRFAVGQRDVAYAYLMFSMGVLLCAVIVACNMAVVRVLCRLGPGRPERPTRTIVHKDSRELTFNATTPDELSFAKLMIILCLFFVACWLPQMLTIVVAQVNPAIRNHVFYYLADACMALNFTLDPVLYVLSRRQHRRGLRRLFSSCFPCCWMQGRGSARSMRIETKISREGTCHSEPNHTSKSSFGIPVITRLSTLRRTLSAPPDYKCTAI